LLLFSGFRKEEDMSYQTVGFWEEEKARSWRGQWSLLVTDREQSRADNIRQKGWDLFRFLIGNGCGEVTREVEDMAVYTRNPNHGSRESPILVHVV
jgi:hypothetical protein